MTRKLSKPDRDAVDLVFDRMAATVRDAAGGDGFVAIANSVDGNRLQSVEEILNVLEMMPAADPPADLAVRTLQHIARRTGVTPMHPAATGFVGPSQLNA